MAEKRYSIVRVDDNWCPNVFDNISMEFICSNKTNIKSEENCKNCRYGDTKEQLVAKVNQALKMAYEERTGNYGYSLKFYEPIARKIVEFLGVEE